MNAAAVLTGLLLFGFTMTAGAAVEGAGAPALTQPGFSGWCYCYDAQLVAKIAAVNTDPRKDHFKFTSLFPYFGSLEFNPTSRKAAFYRHPDGWAAKYADALPAQVAILPIIDGRADHGEFSGWTDEQYGTVARTVAGTTTNDNRIRGLQLDIEPFQEAHLPFYRQLKRELHAQNRILTLFVGPKSDALMTNIFEACDIVVLSGYDCCGVNPGPARFRSALGGNVSRMKRLAAASGGRYMVGIPASAAWGEYEYKVDQGGANRQETGHKQEQYVSASLEVLKGCKGTAGFLGIALWQLGKLRDSDEPERAGKTTVMPDYVRPAAWTLIEDF